MELTRTVRHWWNGQVHPGQRLDVFVQTDDESTVFQITACTGGPRSTARGAEWTDVRATLPEALTVAATQLVPGQSWIRVLPTTDDSAEHVTAPPSAGPL